MIAKVWDGFVYVSRGPRREEFMWKLADGTSRF